MLKNRGIAGILEFAFAGSLTGVSFFELNKVETK